MNRPRITRGHRRALGLIAAAGLIVSACGSSDDSTDAGTAAPTTAPSATTAPGQPDPDTSTPVGGTLRFGLVSDWNLDPAGPLGTAQSMQVALGVYDYLVRPTADGTLLPELLTDWDSDDLATWTLRLRPDVSFHDGTAFDAAALIAHFDRLLDPDTQATSRNALLVIEQMRAVDDLTVEMVLGSPWAAFPAQILGGTTGLIASPAAIAAAGPDYGTVVAVGTGPYTVAESIPGERIVLERNPDYWGDQPSFDTVIYRPIPDEQTRLQSLQAGDIDIMTSINPDVATRAVAAGVNGETFLGLGSLSVQINHTVTPLDDLRVRTALALGVDRDALNQVGYGGGTQPSNGDLPPESVFATGVTFPQTDIARATAIMDEVGPVTLTLAHTPTPDSERVAQILQQMWGDVGITIELQSIEGAQYVPTIFSGQFELALFTGPEVVDADGLTDLFASNGVRNVGKYSNARMDELLTQGRVEADPEQRIAIYREAYAIAAEEVPAVYTVRKVGAIAWSDVVAVVPTPETWGVQIIDVRKVVAAG